MSKDTMTDFNKRVALGARLKELRLKAGYASAEAFCLNNDFSRVLHSNWENGKGNITYKSLCRLASAMNVSLAEVFKTFDKI